MRRALKWIVKIWFVLAVLGGLVFAGLLVFLHTAYGQEVVRRTAEAKLRDAMAGGARIGHISGSPFGEIVVRDLELDGPDGAPAVKVGELRAHVALTPLLRERLELTHVVASDVELAVRREPDGSISLAHLLKPAPPTSWSVQLDAVELHRAHVAYDGAGGPIDLDGIEASAAADLPHDGPIAAGAAVFATWRQRRAPVALTGAVRIAGDRIDVPVLIAAIADASVGASSVHVVGDQVHGELAIHAPAATIAALAPGVNLPDDVAVDLAASPDGGATTHVDLVASLGAGTITGALRVDAGARSVAGFLSGTHLPRVDHTFVHTFVVFDAAPGAAGALPRVHAIAQAWGDLAGQRDAAAIVALDTSDGRVRATVGADDADGIQAAADLVLRRTAEATSLERGLVVAAGRGLAAQADVHGRLAPDPDLDVVAQVDGHGVRFANGSVRELHARVAAAHVPARLAGDVHVEAGGLAHGKQTLERLAIDAHAAVEGDRVELRGVHATSERGSLALDATYEPGRLVAKLSASNHELGSAHVDVDLVPPAKVADAAAWQALPRRAVRSAHVKIDDLQLSPLLPGFGGGAAADLHIRDGAISGRIDAEKLPLPRDLGMLAVHLVLATPPSGELSATADATASELGSAHAVAQLALPRRWLDPAAWRRLGLGALRGATLDARDLAFDPTKLARFGISAQVHGKLSVSANVLPAARGARVAVDVRGLRGGPITRALDIRLDGDADASSTHAHLAIATRTAKLVEIDGRSPRRLDRVLAAPLAAPIEARLDLPSAPVGDLAKLLGTEQAVSGTLAGHIDVAGTIGRPTATAAIDARDLAIAALVDGKPTPVVRELSLNAKWDGETATAALAIDETGGGTLRLQGHARADDWKRAAFTLDARHVELAPLAAFLPGPAGGIRGQLDAKLDVRGLEPRTAEVAGQLHVTGGRVPIAPQIGTLFKADVAVSIANHVANVRASGKLGHGDVLLVGSAPLAVDAPTGSATLTLHGVELVGTTQPVVSATIAAQIARRDDAWHAQLAVRDGDVRILEAKGHPLAPVGAPPDVVLDGRMPSHAPIAPGAKPPPEHPAFIAEITLARTKVESKEVRGDASGKLRVLVGNGRLGLAGDIAMGGGQLTLFDRRYHLDRAVLHFDGTTDPELDIRISYDFPDVTTVTEVRGRASKPELHMTSTPGIYSQSELLGFLLGGEPNADPNQASSAQQRVTSVAGSLLANQVGGYVKKALPVDVDVLRYQSASATSSAAVEVGRWITHGVFLEWRQRLSARVDENAGEGEIEYWLARRMSLSGTVGDRGYDGVDLLWRRRW
jgi:hypothetical protein